MAERLQTSIRHNKPSSSGVIQYPPVKQCSDLHANARRRVPDTFSCGQVGIHWLTCAGFNDLHPLPPVVHNNTYVLMLASNKYQL